MDKQKKICLLGSTGSIGTQSLEVIRNFPERFRVVVLTAENNADLLISQAVEFQPAFVVIGCNNQYAFVKKALESYPIQVLQGRESLQYVASETESDLILNALVGFSGLLPTMAGIRAGKQIALANKETLVVAGELVYQLLKKHSTSLYPIDSEHSAIFQCLAGENPGSVEKLILTASGGPFRGMSRISLQDVKKDQALRHPNWKMGSKITIDSATLMNKGLEVIEARWLFDIPQHRIEVLIHPQSVIHSMVQFTDGSIKAQLGLPDMRIPIQYAITFPERIESKFPRYEFAHGTAFSFERPDYDAFPCLGLAYSAIEQGGNIPCAMNAANEIAVSAFLNDQLSFTGIPDLIEQCMAFTKFISNPSIEDIISTDKEIRKLAGSSLKHFK